MKTNKIAFSNNNNLQKILKINVGSKKWIREFHACVAHPVLSPVLQTWIRLPKKKVNPLWPELVEVDISDERILEMNYSSDELEFRSAKAYALALAEKALRSIQTENDLFELIMDKEWNWIYNNVIDDKRKVILGAVVIGMSNDLSIEAAINKSEIHFEREMERKLEFLAFCGNNNIVNFSSFNGK